jgi:hypothetical protein
MLVVEPSAGDSSFSSSRTPSDTRRLWRASSSENRATSGRPRFEPVWFAQGRQLTPDRQEDLLEGIVEP